ncbi:MAG: hypothetical protein ACYCYL_01195 [Acidithiobacillus sp.]
MKKQAIFSRRGNSNPSTPAQRDKMADSLESFDTLDDAQSMSDEETISR